VEHFKSNSFEIQEDSSGRIHFLKKLKIKVRRMEITIDDSQGI